MAQLTKYKVVLNGTVMPNEDREKVIRELCELFHSKPSYMEKLVDGREIALKKEYDRNEAENICRAIRDAGAQCKLQPVKHPKLAIVEEDFSSLSINEQSSGMFCPSCNRQVEGNWQSCEFCGHSFARKEGDSGFSYTVSSESESIPELDDGKVKQPRKTEVARFIGPNAHFYLEKFESMGSVKHPKFAVSWHWPAFFVFFFWALYRKMWFWAAINQISAIVLMVLTRPSPLWLIFVFIWPMCANYLYFRHTARHVNWLKPNETAEEKNNFLVIKGGVSKPALWAGLILTFAISMFASNMIATQLLDLYSKRHPGIQGESSQMRGDGSVLVNEGGPNSKLGKTSLALNTLATSLKVVIGTGNEAVINGTIASLIEKSENEEIRDAWGHPVVVEQESGRIVFVSPGRDGIEKTPDDILQAVVY